MLQGASGGYGAVAFSDLDRSLQPPVKTIREEKRRGNGFEGSIVASTRKVFCCEFDGCEKKFENKQARKEHMRRHSGDTPYRCPVDSCGRRFKWRSSLASHKKTHRSPGVKYSKGGPLGNEKAPGQMRKSSPSSFTSLTINAHNLPNERNRSMILAPSLNQLRPSQTLLSTRNPLLKPLLKPLHQLSKKKTHLDTIMNSSNASPLSTDFNSGVTPALRIPSYAPQHRPTYSNNEYPSMPIHQHVEHVRRSFSPERTHL